MDNYEIQENYRSQFNYISFSLSFNKFSQPFSSTLLDIVDK
jgi:hypothetical protein